MKMSVESYTPSMGLSVTPSARAHIRSQLEKSPDSRGFRLGIKKSGCSGFMYVVDLVKQPSDNDTCFTIEDGLQIYVDKDSLPVVNGTEIDFVKQGLNAVFQFNNPNSDATCGCGESFSVKEH